MNIINNFIFEGERINLTRRIIFVIVYIYKSFNNSTIINFKNNIYNKYKLS